MALDAISLMKTRLLGDKPFLFGSEATTVDCALFAVISCVLAGDPADDSDFRKEVGRRAQRSGGELSNLRRHWVRMKESYWADWDDKLYKEG